MTNEWKKSSRSGSGGDCVQARITGPAVEIGDSKNPDGPTLTVEPDAWLSLIEDIKNHRLA